MRGIGPAERWLVLWSQVDYQVIAGIVGRSCNNVSIIEDMNAVPYDQALIERIGKISFRIYCKRVIQVARLAVDPDDPVMRILSGEAHDYPVIVD